MNLTIDPEADALYLRLTDGEIEDSEQVASGVVLDLRRAGQCRRNRDVASVEACTKSRFAAIALSDAGRFCRGAADRP